MFFDIIKAECASSEFLGGGWGGWGYSGLLGTFKSVMVWLRGGI